MTLTEKTEWKADHHEKPSTSVTSFMKKIIYCWNLTKDWDLNSSPSFNYYKYNDVVLKEREEEILFADIEIEIKS